MMRRAKQILSVPHHFSYLGVTAVLILSLFGTVSGCSKKESPSATSQTPPTPPANPTVYPPSLPPPALPPTQPQPSNPAPPPAKLSRLNRFIADVKASTAFRKHPARDAFDGSHETAWNEKDPGSGDGQWLEVRFRSPQQIHRIVLTTGWNLINKKGESLFFLNSRVKGVRIFFDSTNPVAQVSGQNNQSLVFDQLNRRATTVRFDFEQVWPGTKWKDLAISEIEFWGPSPVKDQLSRSPCLKYAPATNIVALKPFKIKTDDYTSDAVRISSVYRTESDSESYDVAQIAERIDLNGDGQTDLHLRFGYIENNEFHSDCGNWGECVHGLYLACAPGMYAEMIAPDYYIGCEPTSHRTVSAGTTYIDYKAHMRDDSPKPYWKRRGLTYRRVK